MHVVCSVSMCTELVGWQIAHHRSVHGVRESVEGENMLGVNSQHELTGGMNWGGPHG